MVPRLATLESKAYLQALSRHPCNTSKTKPVVRHLTQFGLRRIKLGVVLDRSIGT